MKIIVVIFFLGIYFLLATHCVSQVQQEYRILVVSGSVINSLQQPLKVGDRIKITEALTFATSNDYLVVLSAKTGRKLIRGVPSNSTHELQQLISDFLKPEKKSTASRGLGQEYLAYLNEIFRDTLVLLGDATFKVNSKQLQLVSPAGVFVFYKSAEKMIGTKISTTDSFCLSRQSIYGNQDQIVTSKVLVEYCLDEKTAFDLPGSGALIGYFLPCYPDEGKLQAELEVIAEEFKSLSLQPRVAEMTKFINTYYGNVERDNLLQWLIAKNIIK